MDNGGVSDLAVFDGSNMFWRSYHGLKARLEGGGEPTWAVHGTLNTIAKVIRSHPADHVVVAFDVGASRYRQDILPTYKSQRKQGDNEDAFAQYDLVVALLREMGVFVWYEAGVEADDVIAEVVRRWREALDDILIVSGDKDFRQLVGPSVSLYRPSLGTLPEEMWDTARISERYGGLSPRQLVDVWALCGDPIDGIPGVRGVGEKTAVKLVQKWGSASAALLSDPKLEGQEDAVRVSYRLVDLLSTQQAECGFDLASTRWSPLSPFDAGARELLATLDRYELGRISSAWLNGSFWETSRPIGTRRLRA